VGSEERRGLSFLRRMTKRVDGLFESWARITLRRYPVIILIGLALTALSFWKASKLRLESDFEAMLPENYQSVQDLRRYQNDVGSTSTLSIALLTNDIDAAKKLSNDLNELLMKEMPDKVDYVEYNIKDVRDFFSAHVFLFAETGEIEEKYEKLKDYIGKRKLKETGLLVDLDEDEEDEAGEEDEPPLDLDKLFADYRQKASQEYGTREDGYYISDKEDLLALSVVPQPGFSGVEKAKNLIAEIDRRIKRLDPKKYAADMEYGFAGPVQVSLDEYNAIKKDILSTLSICISLIFLVLLIYFLRFRPVILISLTLGAGITVTMAITQVAIGFLNAQTAFLGSIIVGTGINYSIILLARYAEERKAGRNIEESLSVAMTETWRATLSAAVTTATAFGTLGLSKNLSFQHFGFIASTGILLIWLTTMLLTPSMTVLSEKILPMVKPGKKYFEIPFMPRFVAGAIVNHPNVVLLVGTAVAVASMVLIIRWVPNSLEYNFHKLRNKMTFQSGTEALDHRIVSEATHRSTTPIVAVVSGPGEAGAYCRALDDKIASDPKRYFAGSCVTINSFIPEDQPKKVELLGRIDALLEKNRKLLPDDFRDQYERHGESLRVKAFGVKDLPTMVRKRFGDKEGGDGVVVVVKPGGKDIWIYENLHRFVDTVREVTLESGKTITATGTPVIFYDLVGTVAHDAPRDTIYAIVGVFIIILLIVGRARDALSIAVTLIVAVAAMVGLVALVDTKINFFNFVAIPTAFGTGADYGINILMRYVSERGEDRKKRKEVLKSCMVSTGGAVFLCSSTTIIGYFSLMTSNNQALVSYGELAIAGEIGCLLAAELMLPALLLKIRA
jgi:predicted RND superfamily exporter protein